MKIQDAFLFSDLQFGSNLIVLSHSNIAGFQVTTCGFVARFAVWGKNSVKFIAVVKHHINVLLRLRQEVGKYCTGVIGFGLKGH